MLSRQDHEQGSGERGGDEIPIKQILVRADVIERRFDDRQSGTPNDGIEEERQVGFASIRLNDEGRRLWVQVHSLFLQKLREIRKRDGFLHAGFQILDCRTA